MASLYHHFRTRALVAAVVFSVSCCAFAGGITVGGTRIVYPRDAKQEDVSVRNTSEHSNFLVQSWVEDARGEKSTDFIVTPPLYVSTPGNENTLRLMYIGNPLPSDRETLYYFNTKAIPSLDKAQTLGKNVLLFAAVTRIKLFVRPSGLTLSIADAPDKLTFSYKAGQLTIHNPTPYYLTLTGIRSGSNRLQDIMVSPFGTAREPLPHGAVASVVYHTINDFGTTTSSHHAAVSQG
ncbi:fimbria/pilus periplasmic chaperone [Enterobacter hormaechei]